MENSTNIQIGFVHHNWRWFDLMSYINAAERWFQKSEWNHVMLKVTMSGVELIFEATSKGVIAVEYQIWLKRRSKKYVKWMDPLTLRTEAEMLAVALNFLGLPYDTKGTLLDQAIYQKTGWWGGHTGDFAIYKQNCSEYVAMILGLPEAYKATPESVYQHLLHPRHNIA